MSVTMGICLATKPSSDESVIKQDEHQSVSKENQLDSRENRTVSIENRSASTETRSILTENRHALGQHGLTSTEDRPTSTKNRSVSTENRSTFTEVLRTPSEGQPISTENRFADEAVQMSPTFKIFNDSGLEGGIAFIYDWRKRNSLLSNNQIIEQAAKGILAEGGLLNETQEAQAIANKLLAMKDRTEREILKCCVYLYTLESFLYRLMNRVLRENDKTKMDTVAPFCYFLTEAIWSDTLADERFYGIVYRGIRVPRETICHYEETIGAYKYWYGFSSTSKRLDQAGSFGNCLFAIDTSAVGGFTVSSLSEFPNEDEIILPPGTTLRIDKVEQRGSQTYIRLFMIPEFRLVLLGRTGSGSN